MSFRQSIVTGALALAVATSIATPAVAQFGRAAELYTPEPGARDLKAVLFNWAWHMGMLRGEGEFELIQTFEYRAEGTFIVD